MTRVARVLAVAAAIVGLAACTAQVSGRGRPAATFPSIAPPPSTFAPPATVPPTTAPATPTPTAAPSAGAFSCPHIVDVDAHLTYDCITTGMTPIQGNTLWTVELAKEVDTSWLLDQRSAPISSSVGADAAGAATLLTDFLVQTDYGSDATSDPVSSAAITVDGRPAQLAQTAVTINPAFAAQQQLKVKTERLWVLVIQVDTDHRSAFMVSVPDVVRDLWPTVPALIKTVHVR